MGGILRQTAGFAMKRTADEPIAEQFRRKVERKESFTVFPNVEKDPSVNTA
jgi:hypothetical protein